MRYLMSTVYFFLEILLWTVGIISALLSLLLFIKLRWPAPVTFILKLYTSALAPAWIVLGTLITVTGLSSDNLLLTGLGLYNLVVYLTHLAGITREPEGWAAFLEGLDNDPELAAYRHPNRYFIANRKDFSLPATPQAEIQRDIGYSGVPGSDQKLRCDLWLPPVEIRPSGTAMIYLHGSAWYLLDKDVGTRTFFKHLAAQGHVIMDVAYRLAPEADMMEMIHDVKRAITWLRENALNYRFDPDQIVLCGGSAGGHLALMAAYTAEDPAFTPPELESEDLRVKSVISLYGPADLERMYFHTRQDLTTRFNNQGKKRKAPKSMPAWVRKRMGADFQRLGFDKGFENAGALAPLLGGHPEEHGEAYRFFSPLSHVTRHCPPTLIIQGEHDLMAPIDSSRKLMEALRRYRVPAFLHAFPQTDHAFDLILPKISCSSHNAIYDIERFLARQTGARSGRKGRMHRRNRQNQSRPKSDLLV